MSPIETVVLVEVVAAIVIAMIIIALAASIKRRRGGKDRLYDPYGLYTPVAAEELAEVDRTAAITNANCAETKQIMQN